MGPRADSGGHLTASDMSLICDDGSKGTLDGIRIMAGVRDRVGKESKI